MLALLEDPALRRQMGTAARERAVEFFELQQSVDATAALFGRLLATRQASVLPNLPQAVKGSGAGPAESTSPPTPLPGR